MLITKPHSYVIHSRSVKILNLESHYTKNDHNAKIAVENVSFKAYIIPAGIGSKNVEENKPVEPVYGRVSPMTHTLEV